jgi:uncharacterized protein (TIGR00369 family)
MTDAERAAHLERLIGLFQRSTIAKSMGMRLSFDGDGTARVELPYEGRFDHYLDDVHGGAIATLIDNAGWFAAAARYPNFILSVEFGVRLHEPAGRQALVARGRVLRAGKRFASCEMEVRNERGALVASGAGTFAVTSTAQPG